VWEPQTENYIFHSLIATSSRTCNFGLWKAKLRGFSPRVNYTDGAITALSAKLVPTFAHRECRVVSATDPHGRILGSLDRTSYYFFQVAPQLYSRGWVNPVPDPLLLIKSGSAWNQTRDLWICSQELWPLDHRGGQLWFILKIYAFFFSLNKRRQRYDLRRTHASSMPYRHLLLHDRIPIPLDAISFLEFKQLLENANVNMYTLIDHMCTSGIKF
jgi:hypothetical protein